MPITKLGTFSITGTSIQDGQGEVQLLPIYQNDAFEPKTKLAPATLLGAGIGSLAALGAAKRLGATAAKELLALSIPGAVVGAMTGAYPIHRRNQQIEKARQSPARVVMPVAKPIPVVA